MLVCDTHVLLWDALAPQRLSRRVQRALAQAEARSELVCSDISLWEIAMLLERGRLRVAASAAQLLDLVIEQRAVRVLPISPAVAVRSQQLTALRGDPADALIAATALIQDSPLATADERIRALPGIKILW